MRARAPLFSGHWAWAAASGRLRATTISIIPSRTEYSILPFFFQAWVEGSGTGDAALAALLGAWRDAGARAVGGCCLTTPSTVAAIAAELARLPPLRAELYSSTLITHT